MAAATSMLDIYQSVYIGSHARRLTVRSIRFLLTTYTMSYHYDDLYGELLTTGTNHCVAHGGARPVVTYLWHRLDKAGLIEWDALHAAHEQETAKLKAWWARIKEVYA